VPGQDPREAGEQDHYPIPLSDPEDPDDSKWATFAPLPEPERRRRWRGVLLVGLAVLVVGAATAALVGPWGPLDPWTVHATGVEWFGAGWGGAINWSVNSTGFSVRGGAQVVVSVTIVESARFACQGCRIEFGSLTSALGNFNVVQSDLPAYFSGGSPATNSTASVPAEIHVRATVATPWANFDGPLWLDLNLADAGTGPTLPGPGSGLAAPGFGPG